MSLLLADPSEFAGLLQRFFGAPTRSVYIGHENSYSETDLEVAEAAAIAFREE